RRDWSTELTVLKPESYWVGYQRHDYSGISLRLALAFPLHLVNRRGTSSIHRDLMIKIVRPCAKGEIWLQPEYRLSLKDAVSTDWSLCQLYAPIAVTGRETTSWIVIALQRFSDYDVAPMIWTAGRYHVYAYDTDTGSPVFEFEFELEETISPWEKNLRVKVLQDLVLTPRRWSKETLVQRDMIRRMFGTRKRRNSSLEGGE